VHPRAAELIATLDLQPHPEGGFYRRIFESADRVTPADDRGVRAAITTTYFLLTADIFSRWHRVRSDEVWHLYEGGPLELFELDFSSRSLEKHILGPVDGEHAPVHVIPAGRWQAARSLGDYALMGCTVGPGFDFADFNLLADDDAIAPIVRAEWPDLSFLV
jgi:predicted cupin superfamily sugar epimerase